MEKVKGVDRKTYKKALRYLSKKFGLKKSDFEFEAAWIDEYVRCLLFSIINEKSRLYKSTVGYQL